MTDQEYAHLTDQIKARGFADDLWADDQLEDIARQLAQTTTVLAAVLDRDDETIWDDELPRIAGIGQTIHAALALRGLLTQRRYEVETTHGIAWTEHLSDVDRW